MCGFSKTRSALRHISRRNHGLIWRGRICPFHFFRAFRRQDSHGKRTLLHRDLPPTKKPLVSHQMQPNAAGSATPSFAVRHNQVVKNCFHHTQTRPAMVRWCIGERMKEIMSRKGICSRFQPESRHRQSLPRIRPISFGFRLA